MKQTLNTKTFYTQYGWQGNNYDRKLTTKEIAKLIKQFIKKEYPHFKVSVTTRSTLYTDSINVVIDEQTAEVISNLDELSNNEKSRFIRLIMNAKGSMSGEAFNKIANELIEDKLFLKNYKFYSDKTLKAIEKIKEFAYSYRQDDSDAMIDYFDTNFYFNIEIQ